jgi:hypothetical protein
MTIRHASESDVTMSERIWDNDPFQHGEPCWRRRIFHLLPPVFIDTKNVPKERINMGIKIIPETQAPVRIFKGGVVSSKQDYVDAQNAIRDAKAGQAIIVDMDAKAWEGVDKAETAFANSLRRQFESKGIGMTAYKSGNMQITIRKATALDKHPARGGRAKSK